jgi:tetratricopeptide (TPR) repeat protein
MTAARHASFLLPPLVLLVIPLHAGAEGEADPVVFAAYERSLELVRPAAARHPKEPGIALVLARVHFRAGRFRQALEEFRQALELDPTSGPLLEGLAAAYLWAGENEEAVAAYRRVLTLGDRSLHPEARHRLAEAYTALGRGAEAIEELRVALREGSLGALTLYELGRALDLEARRRAAGDAEAARRLEDEAVLHLEKAIALEPGHAESHYVLGRILLARGDRERGRKELEAFRGLRRPGKGVDEKALEDSGPVFEASTAVELARALASLGETEEALASLERAFEVRPRFVDALLLAGKLHAERRRTAAAMEAYSAVIEQSPDHAEALWNLGMLHLKAGDPGKGGPLLLKGVELRSHFPDGWELLYRLAAEDVLYPERVLEFAEAAARQRPSAANFTSLAVALFDAGRREDAEAVLREGLKRHPEDEELRQGLSALLELKKGGE